MKRITTFFMCVTLLIGLFASNCVVLADSDAWGGDSPILIYANQQDTDGRYPGTEHTYECTIVNNSSENAVTIEDFFVYVSAEGQDINYLDYSCKDIEGNDFTAKDASIEAAGAMIVYITITVPEEYDENSCLNIEAWANDEGFDYVFYGIEDVIVPNSGTGDEVYHTDVAPIWKYGLLNANSENAKTMEITNVYPEDINISDFSVYVELEADNYDTAKALDVVYTDINDKEITLDDIKNTVIKPGETFSFNIYFTIPSDYTNESQLCIMIGANSTDGTSSGQTHCWPGISLGDLVLVVAEPNEALTPGEEVIVDCTITNIYTESVYIKEFLVENSPTYVTDMSGTTAEWCFEKVDVVVKDSKGNVLQLSDNNIELGVGESIDCTYTFTVPENWNESSTLFLYASAYEKNEIGGFCTAFLYYEEQEEVDNTDVIVDVVVEEGTPEVSLGQSEKELLDAILSEEELASGVDVEVKFSADKIEVDNIPEKDMQIINVAVGSKNVAFVLDFNILKIIGEKISTVPELRKPITITIDIPKEFLASNREFSVIRLHDGETTVLKDMDNNPNTITISTDKFSLYTVVYEDAVADVSPATGDYNSILLMAILCMSMMGIVALLFNRKMNYEK